MNNRSELEWAPRVSLAKIRELYIREADGTAGDALVDEVGYALYSRCLSILEFSEALAGRVRCKRCARLGVETILPRKTGKPNELLRCGACGWQIMWRVYKNETIKADGQIHEGNAGAAFRRFVTVFPGCKTSAEKIVAIDRLIHEFHWCMVRESKAAADPDHPGRVPFKPAGVNLLRGSTAQVFETLNALTYGEHTPPELVEAREWWRAQRPVERRFGG